MNEVHVVTDDGRISSHSRSRRFTEEFKLGSVRLLAERQYRFKAVARAIDVSVKSLRDWYCRLRAEPTPCGDNATIEQLRKENKRLRRKIQRADLDREILKKVAG